MEERDGEGYRLETHRVGAGEVAHAWAMALLVLLIVLVVCFWGID